MKISRFVNNPDKPFHSSGYAEVANSGSIGSTSPESFQQRYRIEQNRNAIRKYRDSHVGRAYSHDAQRRRLNVPVPPQKPTSPSSRQQQNAHPNTVKPSIPPRSSFSEPPNRGYNPYG